MSNEAQPKPTTIPEAIVAIQQEAGPIEKDGVVQIGRGGGFKYASAEQIDSHLRPYMSKYGLVIFGSVQEMQQAHEGKTARVTVKMEYTIQMSGCDEKIILNWYGYGEGRSDSALLIAMRYARKSFLQHHFMVVSDEKGEHEEPRYEKPKQQPARIPKDFNPMVNITKLTTERGTNGKPFLSCLTASGKTYAIASRKLFINSGWLKDGDMKTIGEVFNPSVPIVVELGGVNANGMFEVVSVRNVYKRPEAPENEQVEMFDPEPQNTNNYALEEQGA